MAMSIKNFTRPKDEQPYYYSSTVKDGAIVQHDGDPDHAVYESEMAETSRRAGLWHRWVEQNYPHAYDEIGVMNPAIFSSEHRVREQFMNGERSS